jgi:hypothetical protein
MGKEDQMTDYRETRTVKHEPGLEGRVTTFKATQLIWLILGILEAGLALRFLFKLIGANPSNTFASFLYGLTGIFTYPFDTLTGNPQTGNITFEFTTLIAMIVYALLGWALERLVYVLFYRPKGPVSVRQTVVADHTPLPPSSVTRTTVTEERDTRPTDAP